MRAKTLHDGSSWPAKFFELHRLSRRSEGAGFSPTAGYDAAIATEFRLGYDGDVSRSRTSGLAAFRPRAGRGRADRPATIFRSIDVFAPVMFLIVRFARARGVPRSRARRAPGRNSTGRRMPFFHKKDSLPTLLPPAGSAMQVCLSSWSSTVDVIAMVDGASGDRRTARHGADRRRARLLEMADEPGAYCSTATMPVCARLTARSISRCRVNRQSLRFRGLLPQGQDPDDLVRAGRDRHDAMRPTSSRRRSRFAARVVGHARPRGRTFDTPERARGAGTRVNEVTAGSATKPCALLPPGFNAGCRNSSAPRGRSSASSVPAAMARDPRATAAASPANGSRDWQRRHGAAHGGQDDADVVGQQSASSPCTRQIARGVTPRGARYTGPRSTIPLLLHDHLEGVPR